MAEGEVLGLRRRQRRWKIHAVAHDRRRAPGRRRHDPSRLGRHHSRPVTSSGRPRPRPGTRGASPDRRRAPSSSKEQLPRCRKACWRAAAGTSTAPKRFSCAETRRQGTCCSNFGASNRQLDRLLRPADVASSLLVDEVGGADLRRADTAYVAAGPTCADAPPLVALSKKLRRASARRIQSRRAAVVGGQVEEGGVAPQSVTEAVTRER